MTEATLHGGANRIGSHETVLKASGVRLGYGSRTVLAGIELEVRSGEFWFIIGPNGHGKTTLLRALIGSLTPQRGQIIATGDFARHDRIGFVPQECSLNPTLPTTVREFVSLGLVGIRASRRERQERLVEALGKVELAGKEKQDYWSLSGGQRQRAIVARALIRRPSVLIADEPTSGLDLSVETALLESIAELNREQRLTVIMVVHDLAIAARFASHVALVHNGGVDAGRASAILCRENLQRAYRVPIDVQYQASGTVTVRREASRGST
jgi:ABC-type Mn2+/Zn2+ transport system ATPase subunit